MQIHTVYVTMCPGCPSEFFRFVVSIETVGAFLRTGTVPAPPGVFLPVQSSKQSSGTRAAVLAAVESVCRCDPCARVRPCVPCVPCVSLCPGSPSVFLPVLLYR